MGRARRFRAATVVAALVAGLAVALTAGPAPAQAVAAGCASARPTKISGGIYSYPHAYSVNASLGLSFADANRHTVGPDGKPPTSGGYSWMQWVNSKLPASGDPSKGGTRTWGPVCVASNVHFAFIEVYPSVSVNGIRQTNRSVFGGAADEFDVVSPAGGSYSITMRVPEAVSMTTPAVYSNVTGYVNGYLKCGTGCGNNNGKLIPTSAISPVRAFPYYGGSACGVQGFSASADALGPSRNTAAGDYYRINALAGGQCGASSQPYSIRITCNSFCSPSGGSVTRSATIGIVTGKGALFNVTF